MPLAEKDAIFRLRALLNEAQGTGVTLEATASIKHRADAIEKSFRSSSDVSRLYMQVIQRLNYDTPQTPLSSRCRYLRDELERDKSPITATRLCNALKNCGFSNTTKLRPQEVTDFGNTLAPYLRALNEKLKGLKADDDSMPYPERTIRGLQQLRDQLPACSPSQREETERLLAVLEGRCRLENAQAELTEMRQTLRRRLADEDDLNDLPIIDQVVTSNIWAATYPESSLVSDICRLTARLNEKHQAVKTLARLPEVVRRHLDIDEVPTALDAIARSHKELQTWRLRDHTFNQAISAVVDKLRSFYEAVSEDSRAKVEMTVPEMQAHIDRLKLVRGWLTQLPSQKAEVLDLAESCMAGANSASERLQEMLMSELKQRFRQTSIESFADYVASLDDDHTATLPSWRLQMQQLSRAIEAIGNVTTDVDERCVTLLENAHTLYGPTRLTEAIRSTARSYRKALRALEKMRTETIRSTASKSKLGLRLKAIRAQFPNWQRIDEVGNLVSNISLLKAIHRKVESGTHDEIQQARIVADNLSGDKLRSTYSAALRILERAFEQDCIIAGLPESVQFNINDPTHEDRLAGAISATCSLVNLMDDASNGPCRDLFERAWSKFESNADDCRSRRLPTVLKRWLAPSLRDSNDEIQLDALRDKLRSWLQVLGDDALTHDCDQAIKRRRVELRIAAFESQQLFDSALAELKQGSDSYTWEELRKTRDKLIRAAAVQRVEGGNDSDLSLLAETVREHGSDAETLRLFVDDFHQTGNPDLFLIIGPSPDICSGNQSDCTEARWCRLLCEKKFESLAAELAAAGSSASAALRTFVTALEKSRPAAQVLHLLDLTTDKSSAFNIDELALIESAKAVLRVEVLHWLEEVSIRLQTIDRECADNPIVVPSEDEQAQLTRALPDAFLKTELFIVDAMARITDCKDELDAAEQWPSLRSEFTTRLGALIAESEECISKLRRNRDVLDEMKLEMERLLNFSRRNPGVFTQLSARLVTSAIGRIDGLIRLLIVYFQRWHETVTTVDQLLKIHEAGGVGLSRNDLQEKVSLLEDDIQYDFDADRFRMLPKLGELSFANFFKDLEIMVREVDQVTTYVRELHSLMSMLGERLIQCVNRFDQARTGAERLEKAAAITEILNEQDASSNSLSLIYQSRPMVVRSTPAGAHLGSLLESSWFKLLERAHAATALPPA